MAKYRQVYSSFWEDPDMLELTPEEKYFFLWLLTNPHTTQCGVFTVSMKHIEFETGYNRETVEKLVKRFIEYGKIDYSGETREILIVNWLRYNYIGSPKVESCILSELKLIKCEKFAEYIKNTISHIKQYGMDTVSIPYTYGMDTVGGRTKKRREEEEERKEKEEKETLCADEPARCAPKILQNQNCKEKTHYSEIIDYLNQKCNTCFKPNTPETIRLIKARLNQGYSIDDFKKVIDNKYLEWFNDSEMSIYLRPITLFGTKFESYLNQKHRRKPDEMSPAELAAEWARLDDENSRVINGGIQ